MNRVYLFIIVAAIFLSCSKSPSDNIMWEKSFGHGKALFVMATGDTGIVSCGELDGKQYLLFLDAEKNKVLEYKSEYNGSFNKVWTGENYFITAGSTGGKMYLAKIDNKGTQVWDSVFNTTFRVNHTSLCYLGLGQFLAIGSVNADSLYAGSTGLSFIWFDSNGNIIRRNDQVSSSFISAMDAVTDYSGNIFLAITKQGSGGKTKAAIAKYNNGLEIQWEKDISNNPAFGAASNAIILDGSNNPVVTGRTQLQSSTGIEDNTFFVRYMFAVPTDSLNRKYLEYANSGSSVLLDGSGNFLVLNSKCNIINILDQDTKVTGIIRTYASCDSQDNDVSGFSIALDPSGSILIAGTKGGGYYLALKSSTALSPL